MARRRREEQEVDAAARERVLPSPEPLADSTEPLEGPQRLAAGVGNRAFGVLAREGAGVLPDGRVHPDVEAAIAAQRGRGHGLDPATRERVAPALGDSLADVRVHTGPEADALARAVDARAFATGRDLFFAEGEHRPGTEAGERLLAHELAHVVQQRGTPEGGGPMTVSQPGDALEREADRAAEGLLAPAGGATGGTLQRRNGRGAAPTTTITFDEDEAEVVTGRVKVLDPNSMGSGEGEVMQQIDRLGIEISNTQTALLAAIDQFSDDQSFASSAEGEADFNAAFLAYATEKIVGYLLDEVGERVPYFGQVYGLTKGLLDKLVEEDERAQKARGSRAVAEFLASHRAKVVNTFNEQLRKVPDVKSRLVVEYQKVAAEAPELSRPTAPTGGGPGSQPAVAGAAAEFLTKLKGHVDRVAADPPTFETCLQTIVESWVRQSEGDIKSRGGGDIYIDGRILISMKMYKDGESYKVTEKASGKLQAPRADHVIDSLKPVFGSGRTTNDLAILKVATIEVEDEVDWGFNDYYPVRIEFRDPSRIERVFTIPSPVREEQLAKAPAIQRRVLELVKMEDLAVNTLKAAPEGR